MIRLFLFCLFGSVLAAGCDAEVLQMHSAADADAGYIHRTDSPDDLVSDPFELNDARIDGRNLVLNVSYSGGCEIHEFKAYSSSYVYLSHPPGVDLYVTHDSNNDLCEAYPTEDVWIDLSELIDEMGEAFWMNVSIPHHPDRAPIRVVFEG